MNRYLAAALFFIASAISVQAQMLPFDEHTLAAGRDEIVAQNGCKLSDAMCGALSDTKRNVLVIGDSLANDAYNALSTAFPEVNFILLGSFGCAPFDEGSTAKAKCDEENAARDAAIETVSSADDVVLLMNLPPNNDGRRTGYPQYINDMAAKGFRVIVIGAGIRFERPLREIYQRFANDADPFPDLTSFVDPESFSYDPALKAAVEAAGGVFIDRQPFLCPEGVCRSYTLAKDALINMDQVHSTIQGSKEAGAYIRETYPTLFE